MRKNLLITIFLASVLISFAQHPTNLTSSNITSNSADLSWDASICSGNVNFKYRITGSGSAGWNQTNNVTSPYILNNLSPSTSYDWQVKCAGTGGWSATAVFVTISGCNLTSSIVITDAACSNTMNGAIDLEVSNGAPPYSYLWSNGDTTQDLTAINAGTYIVQITDNIGCVVSDTAIVGFNGGTSISQSLTDFEPNPVTAYHQWSYDTLRIINTGCDVRIRPEFTITCDAGPIQQGDIVIKWQHPLGWNQTINYTIDANGNASGYWSFTANDSTGTDITYGEIRDVVVQVKFVSPALYGNYTATWETFEVDILGNKIGSLSPPNTVTLSLVDCANFSIDNIATNNVSCNGGNDGSATVTNVVGGSGSYSYSWSNGTTNTTASNLSAGTYSVIVTDNNFGCTDSSTITISDAAILSAVLTGTSISCNGANDGSLSASGIGGSGQFDFIWTSHPFLPPISSHTNLLPGTYNLDIVDLVCGDIASATYTINEPSIVSISTTSSNNTSCDSTVCNGNISISLSGGIQPYTFIWTNGYSDSMRNDLCGDTYSINAADANGCGNFTETIIISDSASPASASVTGSDISCFGANDGSAEAIIGGGGIPSGGNTSTLSYCASSPGTNSYNTINEVSIIGDGDAINNNTSGSCDTYEDYTAQYATLTPGSTYTISVQLGSCHGSGFFNPDSTGIFIDWNIDGDFDDVNERIDVLYSTVATTHNINITVPNIAYGPTRMRIVSHSQINNPSFPDGPVNPCVVGDFGQNGTYSQPWYGATEDYSIVISGTIPATYLWNTGDTTNTISNLSAGTYYCEVTDTNNCSATDTVTINEPSVILVSTATYNVSCNGGNDGTVNLSISGGTPPYTEDWGSNNPLSLVAGTYNYTITDVNGCTYSDSVTITEPSPISIVSNITNILCYGDTTGGIDITITGGTNPYSYTWNNGSTSEDISNVTAGTYFVSVVDSNACTIIDTIIINEPSAISVLETTTNVLCNGDSSGSAILTLNGGTGNLTQNWGSNNPSALSAGIYNYIISDSNGCTYSDSVTITEPNPISTIPTITNVSCNGLTDGSAVLSIAGGVATYTEDWGSNNPSALSAGTYNYVVTDMNGCIYSDSVTITEPLILSAAYTSIDVDCFGNNTGNANVTISGGTVDYTLSWDTLTYTLQGGINIFSTQVGVPAGTYPFGVTDANGCYFTDTIIINEPSAISALETTTNVLCNGDSSGSAILTLNGGTGNLTQNWGSNNPSALSAGTYNYIISDSNGCTYSDSVTITEPNAISSSILVTNLSSCITMNGSLDLSVAGGIPPYTYIWNNNDTTQDISGLSAGNYFVNITDANGCSLNDTATVNQPSNNLSLTLSTTDYNGFGVSCYGGDNGQIYSNASGGTGTLSYLWSDMSNGTSLTNQYPGVYSLTVTDSVGCSLTDSIVITEPISLNSTYSTTNVLCNGDSTGSATVIFSGGVTDYLLSWGGYTYPLQNGGNIFVTPVGVPAGIYPYSVTDLNGCMHFDTITITEPNNISSNATISNYNGYNVSCNGDNNGSVTLNLSGGTGNLMQDWLGYNSSALSAGTYNYIITDANGCVFSDSVTITEPLPLIVNLSGTNLSCYNSCDGEITAQVTGGVSSYNYSWSNGQSGSVINNLCVGTFSISITDQNNCTTSNNESISEPSEIIINVDSTQDVSSYNGNDGHIYISVSGGTSNYSYNWTGPNGYSSTNNNILGLASGYYIITAIDTTNCSSVDTIYINQPSSLSVSLDSTTNLVCHEECNGSLYITANGGDSIYSYLWTGPNGFTSTDEDIDSLCAGTYELTVSDTTTSIYTSFTIIQPSQLSIITIADTILCYGDSSQVSAYCYGGTSPYQIMWDNGSTSVTTYLNAGNHYINVTDANGCLASGSINVIQNDSIDFIINETDISCFGLSDGSVDIHVLSGGLPPYTYSSDNGQSFQNTNTFVNLPHGTSHYMIMDANGCLVSSVGTIIQPPLLTVLINSTDVSCYQSCDGTATAIINGGTGNYYEDWGSLDPDSLCAGLVNLIVQDDNGCLATSSAVITEPNPIIVSITNNNGVLEATPGFLFYQWLDGNGNPILGATSQYFTPTTQGQYAVQVTTSDLCTKISDYINLIIESISTIHNNISIYPNPTNGIVTIETNEYIQGDIRLMNNYGKIISIIKRDKIFEREMTIDMTHLSKGIYVIQLINNETIINHKIILQ